MAAAAGPDDGLPPVGPVAPGVVHTFRTYGDALFALLGPSEPDGPVVLVKVDGKWRGPYSVGPAVIVDGGAPAGGAATSTPAPTLAPVGDLSGDALVALLYREFDIAKRKSCDYLRFVGYPGVRPFDVRGRK